MKKKIVFIVNPVSGIGRHKNIVKWIGDHVDREAYDFSIEFTECQGHATDLCKQAVEEGAYIVVAVGGDGTVNETGKALIGTGTALGIIPAGSGNGLARHLRIPFNFRKAIAVINRGKVKKIDTATVNDQIFLNMAGVGYEAFVAKKFAQASKRGFFSYFRIVSGEYPLYKSKKYTITADGKTYKRKALSISFANSSQWGNNVMVDPNASIDDGFLDLCIIRKIPLLKVPFVVPMLFTRTFHKTQYIEIIRAREITIHREKGKSIHLDGDPFTMGEFLELKVNPLSLNVVIP